MWDKVRRVNIQPRGDGNSRVFVFRRPNVISGVDDYAQSHIRSYELVRMHNCVDCLQHCAPYGVSTYLSFSEGW